MDLRNRFSLCLGDEEEDEEDTDNHNSGEEPETAVNTNGVLHKGEAKSYNEHEEPIDDYS